MGHRALVTGVGHRQGIGYAVAARLTERGDRVFVTRWGAFDASRPYNQEADVPNQKADVPWPSCEADLEDPKAPRRVFDDAEAALGGVDVLILNHAHFERDDLACLRADVLDRHLAINVRGSLLLCQEFARRNDSGWGRIVLLTSGQGLHPMPNELSYAVSKGAVEAASLSLAGGLAPKGITVNAVDPGGTDTGWMPPAARERWSRESPRGRVGTAEDAARIVAFLASDEASWITGQLVRSRGSV